MIKLITPQWHKPDNVMAYSSTRHGGVSLPPWHSLNPGAHCGDNPAHVAENRQRLFSAARLPSNPVWLEQVHGQQVLRLPVTPSASHQADASWTDQPGIVCAVMTADCLPVLLCNKAGNQVAAAHAGWRGLCAGILENTVASFHDKPEQLLAWLGPAIGPDVFEVGTEVRHAFMAHSSSAACAFQPYGGKYLANLYQLARLRLNACGVSEIYGGDYCTYQQAADFFSWRRDGGKTGRMVSLIWLQ